MAGDAVLQEIVREVVPDQARAGLSRTRVAPTISGTQSFFQPEKAKAIVMPW